MRILYSFALVLLAACASTSTPPPVEPVAERPAEENRAEAPEPDFGRANAPEPVFELGDAAARCSGEGYHCVRVIYGTNRDRLGPQDDPSGQQAYGTEPEIAARAYQVAADMAQLPTTTRLETGEVIVTIPAVHRRGDPIRSLGSRRRVSEDDRGRYFSFLGPVDPFADHAGFRDAVASLYEETDERDAILHVHGFNVSFRAGAFRAAQLKSDTGFDGPVFYFSWPSNARLTEYFNDQVDGDISARALANFMLQAHNELPEGGTLHVIAHSMGSRVFSQAAALLRDSGLLQGAGEEPMFGAVILAAGDLDSGLASEWLGEPDALARSVTFLTSRNDRAVAFSGILRNFFLRSERRRKTRIGFFKPKRGPVIFPGVNVFDITFLKTGFWERFAGINHSTYAEDDFSLRYISRLIDDPDMPPQALAAGQASLQQCRASDGTSSALGYWVLGALSGRRVCSQSYQPVGALVTASREQAAD